MYVQNMNISNTQNRFEHEHLQYTLPEHIDKGSVCNGIRNLKWGANIINMGLIKSVRY